MPKKIVLSNDQQRAVSAVSATSRVSPKNLRDQVPAVTAIDRTKAMRQQLADKTSDAAQLNRRYGVVDKLMLVLPRGAFPEKFLEEVAGRLSQSKSKQVLCISRKGNAYRHMFVLTCPSGAKVVFGLVAAKQGMHHALKITLNPAQMDLPDTRLLYEVLKFVFMPDWKEVMRSLLIQRVDQAYDHPVAMADLLVTGERMLAEEKYYVNTDRGGHIQSWYCGSIESLLHYITYDQNASDDYKVAHGEKPSRTSPYADAEVVIDKKPKADMTRFEARRVLERALPLNEVDRMASPFGRFTIYLIDAEKIADGPEFFMLYLESVRMRGVSGAAKYFRALWPGTKVKQRLAVFEAYLSTCIAPWWDRSGLNCLVKYGLQQTPCWNVLKHLAHGA